jgi:predicted helicase
LLDVAAAVLPSPPDQKVRVIGLFARVTTVSVRTMEIVEAMKSVPR